MDGNGRNVRRLTTNAGVVGGAEDLEFSHVAWSRQGDAIAFDSAWGPVVPNCPQHCSGWAVSVVGSDGSGSRQIALNARAPAWSPDGRSLAYESGVRVVDYDDATGVKITRLDGSGTVELHAYNCNSEVGPVWSPRGDRLAFQAAPGDDCSSRSVYVVRPDGSGKRRLAAGHDPTWSPDGRRMAFVSDYRLVAIGADGKGRRRLSRKGEYVVTAAWSPKSGTIAYIAGKKPTGYGGLAKNLHLETVGADGKHVRALAHVSDGVLAWGRPVWTRDGKRILLAGG